MKAFGTSFEPAVNGAFYLPEPIENEEAFWRFIKACFAYPRRTLGNNLKSTHYDLSAIEPELLKKRAQQLSMADFLRLWPALD